MDAKERMCLVLDYTGLNANSLSQKIGLPKYRLYDITQGRTKAVTYEIADKITSSFTTISKDWLLTGEGSMLLSDNPNSMKNSVKEFRVRHELTQKEMSDLLGISPRMVQKYESGESPLPEDKQMRMELFEGSKASTGEGVAKETSSLISSDVVRYYPNIPATAGGIEYSVKEFRLRHGLTQQEVADLLGVHIRSVQKYENGMGIRGVKRRILEEYDREHCMEMKDRLLEFIAYLGVSNYAFEKAVGLSNGYVRSLNGAIGADKLLDICRAYPQLSRDWLLTGVGDMVVNPGSSETGISNEELTPKTAVRYYPNIPITASHIEDMPNPSDDDMECQYLTIPGFEGCVAFPAVGDSMYPRISNGDIVVFREWQESYISNGEIYLIITRLGDRTIKYLTQITDEDGGKHYLCRSANPDQEKYAPFEIDGDDIVRLFAVCGCIKKFRM